MAAVSEKNITDHGFFFRIISVDQPYTPEFTNLFLDPITNILQINGADHEKKKRNTINSVQPVSNLFKK